MSVHLRRGKNNENYYLINKLLTRIAAVALITILFLFRTNTTLLLETSLFAENFVNKTTVPEDGVNKLYSFLSSEKNVTTDDHFCYVTQKGKDGFGHQLSGMLSVAALHGMRDPTGRNYRFRFYGEHRPFQFEHLSQQESTTVEQFLTSGMDRWVDLICGTCSSRQHNNSTDDPKLLKHKFVHEFWNIPYNCSEDNTVIYELDNMFRFVSDPHRTNKCMKEGSWKDEFIKQQHLVASIFRKGLPKADSLPKNSTSVHIRLGDARSRTRYLQRNPTYHRPHPCNGTARKQQNIC